MPCIRQFTAKYASRPGPPFPANEPGCRGKLAEGNDGLWYESRPDNRGVHTWKKMGYAPGRSNARIVSNRSRSRSSTPAAPIRCRSPAAAAPPRRQSPSVLY